MGFADDIVTILQNANVGVYNDTIYIGAKVSLPNVLTPFITIGITAGRAPEGTHNDGTLAYPNPSAQIVARAEVSAEAEAMAQAAFNAIAPIKNQKINGVWWQKVTMLQSQPFELGEDDRARPRWAFNINVTKRPSSATS